jgi:ABC-type sugar transport system substrate-binding protein
MSTRRRILRLMRRGGAVLLAAALILAAMALPALAQQQTATPPAGRGGGPYVVLTGDFFKAMEKLSQSQADTYGDQTQPLLEKIAVATQFAVKTNLTIIKQNDRIIQLLEELNRKRLLQER